MINNQLPYADSIDGEVVEDTAAKELVIPTQREAPGRQPALPRGGQPQPILAPWMKDRAEFIYKMQDVGKRAAHILGWHLCHAPANALRVLWFAFRTLCFIVVGASRWVFDLEGGRIHELSHEDYFKEKKLRDQRREDRAKIAGFVLGAVVVTVLIVWWWTPAWVSWGLLVCVVVVLALIGRPRDKPFIMPATIAPGEDTPLTADVVFENPVQSRHPQDDQTSRSPTALRRQTKPRLGYGEIGASVLGRRTGHGRHRLRRAAARIPPAPCSPHSTSLLVMRGQRRNRRAGRRSIIASPRQTPESTGCYPPPGC